MRAASAGSRSWGPSALTGRECERSQHASGHHDGRMQLRGGGRGDVVPCTAAARPPPAHSPPLPPLLPMDCCRREEVAAVYNTPLLDLVYNAATVHRMYNDPAMVRLPVHRRHGHRRRTPPCTLSAGWPCACSPPPLSPLPPRRTLCFFSAPCRRSSAARCCPSRRAAAPRTAATAASRPRSARRRAPRRRS